MDLLHNFCILFCSKLIRGANILRSLFLHVKIHSTPGISEHGNLSGGSLNRNDRFHRAPRTSSGNYDHSSRGRQQSSNFRNSQQNDNNSRFNFPQSDSGHTHQSRQRRPIGFKALESLLEKDPEELILELSNSKRGFTELLQSTLTEDTIILFIKIIKKVIDSTFEDTKYKILQMYFDGAFVEQLIKYIVFLPMQSEANKRNNRYFWNDQDQFWYNILEVCTFIYDRLPTFSRKVLPDILKSLNVCFPSFQEQHNCHISDEIKERARKLKDDVQMQVEEYEESQKVKAKEKMKNEDDEEPPDDFRQISVYPSSLELNGEFRSFLRKNIVKGAYRDVNHYLDVQFRLLREDFVGPLRSGIKSYCMEMNKKGQKKRIENVKIYPKVQFLHPETVNEQYCIRLRFDSSKKKKDFKYENSKRFMFGSLICFTADNFKSFLFGKIAERKLEDLQKGELIVGFDQNVSVQLNINYVMVECGIYFEPYYHVLNVLQHMSVDNFPMEKYIIRVDPSVLPPEYLTKPGCTYTIRGHTFSPLLNWPNTNFYNLNDSQLTAFKAALTQEFSIIQGPPGTGKTFLGLKIAKTLLENQGVWYNKTPMLVICYTNHALDQFLEGLTEFTKRILRVGGQSKNENLKSFNLRNQTKFKMNAAILQQRAEVRLTLAKIQSITENLKQIESYHSIRSFDAFERFIPNFKDSWFGRAKKDAILDWLLGRRKNSTLSTEAVTTNVAQLSETLQNIQLQDVAQDDDLEDSDEDEVVEVSEVQIDDIFDDLEVMATQTSIPILTLSSMQRRLNDLMDILNEMNRIEEPTAVQLLNEDKYSSELFELRSRYEYLNARLIEGKQRAELAYVPPLNINYNNPQDISPDHRWNLYFYWLRLYKQNLQRKLERLNEQFRDIYKIYEEMRDIENTNSMKSVLVVGMTTTGAARLRSSLQALRSPIVIVEEAAEVLEAHIISSLTKHCKHLILIGDHQQLKPSTANYEIERFYNLGISLFERMVINKIQLFTLNVQHRMRSEISSLIVPAIYPTLNDHPSVHNRPRIKGLDNCLFFLDHTNLETECEGASKKNYHEVQFLINFAKHLVLNGYQAHQITILAAYLGQMFEMQKEKKKYKHVLENVRIAVLDNYQGEECDIILLSLVRSNNDKKIGFLSIENRVCVALSRARNGFYIMGNMSQLCSQSELWGKIRRCLEQQSAIGTELALRCQVHNDKVTYVKSGEDFLGIPEGGCNQICGSDLVCGHKCTICCHIKDRDHNEYRCREICNKRLCDQDPQHLCKLMCYQDCGPCKYPVPRALKCGHTVNVECYIDPEAHKCTVPVSTTLPCGHVADKPCHCSPETFRCPHPCEIKVEPCGHACQLSCHVRRDPDHLQYTCKKKCARFREGCTVKEESHLCQNLCYEECEPCRIPVKKERSVCPHWYDVECRFDVDEIVCKKPCTKMLSCGHKCKRECHEPCGNCTQKVEKTLAICGHIIKQKCCETPDRKLCAKKCPLKLPCGHNCTKKCNEPCTTDCMEIVQCALTAPCGHNISQIKCSLKNSDIPDPKILLKYCKKPCNVQLKCGHRCSGSCGECYQGRIHKACNERCGFPLVCNHPCEFPCRQACRPCSRPCPYKCKHSSCSKRCGEVCTPCKERCPRNCPHQRCTQFCGAICNVPPCQTPCRKILKCGHPCISFCGEPCPPKCLVCDNEELTTIMFGHEDEENARFVLLNDCGHILESKGLETWLNQNEDEIAFKLCPQCKTPIKTTHRYSESIKRALEDVAKVKSEFYGSTDDIVKKRAELLGKLQLLLEKGAIRQGIIYATSGWMKVFAVLQKRLQVEKKNKRQAINKSELSAVESKLQIVNHIMDICAKDEAGASPRLYSSQIDFLIQVLLRDENHITNQEIDDIQYELNRLSRLVEFNKIKKHVSVSNGSEIRDVVTKIEKLLFGFEKFYDSSEANVKKLLEELNKLLASGMRISEKERREIVAAVGLRQGHWYKCPNGHPYAIGECGGAMEEAKCPECGAKIGGRNHQLTPGNAVATEMDGATFAAWSDTANNMGNYRFL